MKKILVTITETLEKQVEVEAEDRLSAEQKVEDQWRSGEYVLTADDFTGMDCQAEEMKPEKIMVVLLEPGKLSRTAEIGTTLEDMQSVVDGMIEAAYYLPDPDVCLVVNEEGKVNGLPLNRGVRDKDGHLIDIIAGTAFICDCSGENFGSLSDEQIKKYSGEFKFPEHFFRVNGEIQGVKFNPNRDRER